MPLSQQEPSVVPVGMVTDGSYPCLYHKNHRLFLWVWSQMGAIHAFITRTIGCSRGYGHRWELSMPLSQEPSVVPVGMVTDGSYPCLYHNKNLRLFPWVWSQMGAIHAFITRTIGCSCGYGHRWELSMPLSQEPSVVPVGMVTDGSYPCLYHKNLRLFPWVWSQMGAIHAFITRTFGCSCGYGHRWELSMPLSQEPSVVPVGMVTDGSYPCLYHKNWLFPWVWSQMGTIQAFITRTIGCSHVVVTLHGGPIELFLIPASAP